jgi:catalase
MYGHTGRLIGSSSQFGPSREICVEADPPATAEQGGFVSYPQKQQGAKKRALPDKFKEHFNQAQVFFRGVSPPTFFATVLARSRSIADRRSVMRL